MPSTKQVRTRFTVPQANPEDGPLARACREGEPGLKTARLSQKDSRFVSGHRFTNAVASLQPRSGVRMQPTAQAVGRSGKPTSPSGAKDEFSRALPPLRKRDADSIQAPEAPTLSPNSTPRQQSHVPSPEPAPSLPPARSLGDGGDDSQGALPLGKPRRAVKKSPSNLAPANGENIAIRLALYDLILNTVPQLGTPGPPTPPPLVAADPAVSSSHCCRKNRDISHKPVQPILKSEMVIAQMLSFAIDLRNELRNTKPRL